MLVLCIAGRSFLDEAAAALFVQILEKHGMGAKVGPAGALTADRISRLSAEGARLVCLSYFDADLSTAGTRFAVRRLRRRLGEIKILPAFGRAVLDKRASFAPRRRWISAQRDLGTRSTFVSRGRRPKHSRMKSRRLRSKLCPERDDLVEHTFTWRVFANVSGPKFSRSCTSRLQAGNAKGACQTAFNPGIDSTREPRRSPRHGVQEAGGR